MYSEDDNKFNALKSLFGRGWGGQL
jgi:hypothetical protein